MNSRSPGRTLVSFVLVLMSLSCSAAVDRRTADRLAEERVSRYLADEGLDMPSLSDPEVTQHQGTWLYGYKYAGRPRQALVVTVGKDGSTELGRMPEEEAGR